ncbi:Efflux pump rdc3 [Lachnellula arida]|uniref:Efflux pump rdc3 n=1 Tax=Lachnellula arida TaxID=1316785 RepID=A0A8T9B2L4_9HELO|nr:Efflux pump rdc3 [Lachnellula arida]
MSSIEVSFSSPDKTKFEDSTTQRSNEGFISPPEETANQINYLVNFDGLDDQSNPINWPLWYRWTLIIVLSSVNTIANLATVLCLPAAPQILNEFHTQNTLYITIIASIWELGEAMAALLTAPLSEIFGRAPIYNVTNTMFVVFSIASGLSTSPGMLIAFRFLNGMGDASISLNASIAGDLFIQEERGLPIAILSFPPLIGPVVGPIIGGYLTQTAGWRWAFWFSAIAGGVFELAFFFTFRETYTPQILRGKAQKLRKETGNPNYYSRFDFDTRSSGLEILKDGLFRPAIFFFSSPIVFTLSIQVSIAYGYMYILFTTLTPVFEQTYHFNQGAAGLAFLGLSIGMVIGVAVCAFTLDRLLKRYTAQSGVFKPEIRLLPMAVGGALFPLGLFLYGWSAEYRVFYIVPMIGTATVGLGYFITNIPLQAYLVDVYHQYAASAVGATVVLRCIFATILPLGALPLYNRLGLGWGNSVLGFIAVLFIPVPLVQPPTSSGTIYTLTRTSHPDTSRLFQEQPAKSNTTSHYDFSHYNRQQEQILLCNLLSGTSFPRNKSRTFSAISCTSFPLPQFRSLSSLILLVSILDDPHFFPILLETDLPLDQHLLILSKIIFPTSTTIHSSLVFRQLAIHSNRSSEERRIHWHSPYLQGSHATMECKNPRKIDYSGVDEVAAEEAWAQITAASTMSRLLH